MIRLAVEDALPLMLNRIAQRAVPPKPMTVSQWADQHRVLSSKQSPEPGRWRTARNPPLREVLDSLSRNATCRDIVCMFPVQFGKTEVALNLIGYSIDHYPGPVMICLPGEKPMKKWIDQKLQPMLDETPRLVECMTSTASRNAANRADFKDFAGGQLYVEHAGSPARLKTTSVRTLVVDELDEFASSFSGSGDPVELVKDRTSAFRSTAKRLFISTPSVKFASRIDDMWEQSDKRRYHVPCPECGHGQPLLWPGITFIDTHCMGYACVDCGVVSPEAAWKSRIAAGQWVPENQGSKVRGYHINALYYPLGLGETWQDLVDLFLKNKKSDDDLQVFVNSRLAEPFEDRTTSNLRDSILAERAEPYALRTAAAEVLEITCGVDTQDNRLAVQLIGWTRTMHAFVLDYTELPGDPDEWAVWTALIDYVNQPIEHASGALLRPMATAIDAAGHRTEAVKNFCRGNHIRRAMCIFGSRQGNAPLLSRPKDADVTWKGKTDKRGVRIWQIGTIAAKHVLFGRLRRDETKAPEERAVRFSDQLPAEYYTGVLSEVFNRRTGRYEKKTSAARNEPLDTLVYAYAAAHHPEVALHRRNKAQWDAAEKRLAGAKRTTGAPPDDGSSEPPTPSAAVPATNKGAGAKRPWTPRRGGGWMKG